jgi:hypothetical protein
MNSTYYFGVMVRLFSIALFVYGVGKLGYVMTFASNYEGYVGPSTVFSLLSSTLPILISIIIWFFPLTVARSVLPIVDETETTINTLSVLTVFILAIGLYTFYYAIIDGVYWITLVHVFVRDEFGNISKVISNDDKANIVVTVVEFVLAVVLLIRARTIARLLSSFAR